MLNVKCCSVFHSVVSVLLLNQRIWIFLPLLPLRLINHSFLTWGLVSRTPVWLIKMGQCIINHVHQLSWPSCTWTSVPSWSEGLHCDAAQWLQNNLLFIMRMYLKSLSSIFFHPISFVFCLFCVSAFDHQCSCRVCLEPLEGSRVTQVKLWLISMKGPAHQRWCLPLFWLVRHLIRLKMVRCTNINHTADSLQKVFCGVILNGPKSPASGAEAFPKVWWCF